MKKHKSTPISDKAIAEDLPKYFDEIKERMEHGKLTYGDPSFSREPLDLVRELKQECIDIPGWQFILWRRLCEIERILVEQAER